MSLFADGRYQAQRSAVVRNEGLHQQAERRREAGREVSWKLYVLVRNPEFQSPSQHQLGVCGEHIVLAVQDFLPKLLGGMMRRGG